MRKRRSDRNPGGKEWLAEKVPFLVDKTSNQCYSVTIKLALKEKRSAEAPREERLAVKAFRAKAGRYHSGAVREDRAGASRYRGHERRSVDRKQGGTVELNRFTPELHQGWSVFVLPRNWAVCM